MNHREVAYQSLLKPAWKLIAYICTPLQVSAEVSKERVEPTASLDVWSEFQPHKVWRAREDFWGTREERSTAVKHNNLRELNNCQLSFFSWTYQEKNLFDDRKLSLLLEK